MKKPLIIFASLCILLLSMESCKTKSCDCPKWGKVPVEDATELPG